MTVVLVEQSVNVALTVADRAYFMERGEIRFSGPTAELLDRPDLLRSVFLSGGDELGRDGRRAMPTTARPPTYVPSTMRTRVPILSVDGLSVTFGGIRAVDDVTFEVGAGEIVGDHRPERRRQDHDVRPHLRLHAAAGRADHAGRQGRHLARAPRVGPEPASAVRSRTRGCSPN